MPDAPPRSPPRLSQSPSTPTRWLLSPLPRRTHASVPPRNSPDGDTVAYESISNIPREEWASRRITDDGGELRAQHRLQAVSLAVSCVVLLSPFAAGIAVALALQTQGGDAPAGTLGRWEVDLLPALGALAAGAGADAFGRQRALCVANLLLALSCLLTCFQQAHMVVVATGVFRAAGVGAVATAATLYVVEALAGPRHRGRAACSTLFVFLAGGTVCTCAVHMSSATPQAVAVIAAVLACLSTVAAAAVLPDTPLWLASVGALRAAEDVLCGLRAPEDAGAEASDLSTLFGIASTSSTSPPRRSTSSSADVVVLVTDQQVQQRPQRARLTVWLVIVVASLLACITCPAASAALLGAAAIDTQTRLLLIHFLSAALGAGCGAYAVDVWGRRTTLVVGSAAVALCGAALAATLLASPASGTRLAYATAAAACLVACTTGGPVCAALTLAHEAHQHKRGAWCGAAWAVAMLLVSAGCATVRVTAGRSVEAAGLVAIVVALAAALIGLAFAAAAPHVLPPTAGLPWSQLHAALHSHGAVVAQDGGGARRGEGIPRLGPSLSSPLREPLLHSPASQHSALTAALRAAATDASFDETESPPPSPHRGSQGGPGSSVESSTPSMRGLIDDAAQGGPVPMEGGRPSPKGPAVLSGPLRLDDAATFPGFQRLILPSGDSPAASKPPKGGARRSLR